MMTRLDFFETVGSQAQAIEFENEVLQALPQELTPLFISRVTKEGKEPDSRYWDWLIGQFEKMRADL